MKLRPVESAIRDGEVVVQGPSRFVGIRG
jgi:hypothetical protein